MTESDEYHQTASAPSWPCLECKISTVLYRGIFTVLHSSFQVTTEPLWYQKVLCCKQNTNRASAEILWNYCQFYVAVMFLYGVSWGRICSWWCQVSFFCLLFTRVACSVCLYSVRWGRICSLFAFCGEWSARFLQTRGPGIWSQPKALRKRLQQPPQVWASTGRLRSPTHSGDTLFENFCCFVQNKGPFWRTFY